MKLTRVLKKTCINFLSIFFCRISPSILMYHSINIGKESLYFNVLPNDFEWQIKYLKEREFSFVSMDEIYLYLSGQLKLKPKSVCITFDDGYKDNLTQALPILEKYKIPAIIYIATDYIDRGLGAKELPTCTWDDIKYLHSHSLITIGGHTINHKRLNELEPEEAFNEIDEGKKILERKIGGKVNHFAYPKGLYGPKTPSLVKKAGYLTAVTVSPGLLSLQKNPDLFLLPRIPIDKSMDNQSFQLANRMGAGIYYDLRKFFKGN